MLGQRTSAAATASAILNAAQATGMRVNLLHTVYARASMADDPLTPPQARFATGGVDDVA